MSLRMHPADILALVRKKDSTLAAVARSAGLSESAIRYALKHPARRAEAVLAGFLGVSAVKLWPDRYHTDGTRRVRLRSAATHGDRISARRTRERQ